MIVAGAGVGLGLLAAWPLKPLLSGFLYGAAGVDPATALVVVLVLVLLCAAGLASATPALRAARTDPAAILREA
jgi:putative ABC transport system permease protein